jgi:uncharacterized Zn finger protein (UPF0148 family)
MHCIVCNSEEFREDEQGFFYCEHCHTQSQNYFAESFENEDKAGRLTRRIQPRAFNSVKKGADDPDVYHYLLLMQNALRHFARVSVMFES